MHNQLLALFYACFTILEERQERWNNGIDGVVGTGKHLRSVVQLVILQNTMTIIPDINGAPWVHLGKYWQEILH